MASGNSWRRVTPVRREKAFTGHGGSLVAVEEAEHFFVHFDQKGPVKLVAEHNQARVVSDVKKPLHFPEQPPVC